MPWGEIVFGGAFQMSKFKQTKNCRVFWTRIKWLSYATMGKSAKNKNGFLNEQIIVKF